MSNYQSDLRRDKRTVREFVAQHWDDEKLAQVYAFNRDGRMHYDDSCRCLLGVTLSDRLHCGDLDRTCGTGHYERALGLPLAIEAERAYLDLAWDAVLLLRTELRRTRLSAILRAEMRLRGRLSREHIKTQAPDAAIPVP